jgi:hypothetical protein
MERIRDYYKVPAKRGGKIIYSGDGVPKKGTIKSAKSGRLRVLLEGYKHLVTLHPTWEIEYLTE